MNKSHHHLTEVEATAWVLIAIFVAVLLIFSYLIWRRLSPDMPRASQSEDPVKVALYSEPRLVIMRPNDVAGQIRSGRQGTSCDSEHSFVWQPVQGRSGGRGFGGPQSCCFIPERVTKSESISVVWPLLPQFCTAGSKISAEFKDGVLKVHLPKNDKARSKALEVRIA